MTEDVSGRFNAWMHEHYYFSEERTGPVIVCRRCQRVTGYLTKHAVVRHGDDIEIMPGVNKDPWLKLMF